MINQEILDEKFQACTSYSLDDLKLLTSSVINSKKKQKVDFVDFKSKLIGSPLEDYSEHLYYFMVLAQKRDIKRKMNNPDSIKYNQNLGFKEQLVNAFKIIFLKDQVSSIKIKKSKTYTIENKNIIDIILSSAIFSVWDEIIFLELNKFSLSHKEAIEEINNQKDVDWIKDWMDSMGYVDPNYKDFSLGKFDNYYESLNMMPIIGGVKDKIQRNLISEYAYDHPHELPMELQTIDRILDRIKSEKPTAGRKEDTADLKFLAYELSVLLRVDRYLESENIETIDNIPFLKEDKKLIHDVMAFFGLIIDYRENEINTKILKPRINKMLGAVKDPVSIEDINEKLRILKLGLSSQT